MEETVWTAGKLKARGGGQRLLFGWMHEDFEIERKAFSGKMGPVFSIASAGDTALALAEEREVVACDVNPVQLAYAWEHAKGGRRQMGDAERAMGWARMGMPFIGWRRGVVEELLAMKDVGEQMGFWKARMNTWRFRLGMDLLMAKAMLRMVYSRELLDFLPKRMGKVVRERMERGFARHACAENPYARAMLTGEREERVVSCAAVRRVTWVEGDAASVLAKYPAGTFAGFTLSNILDGATEVYRAKLMAEVQRTALPRAVVVVRSFREPEEGMVGNLAAEERTMLWGVVEVRVVG